MEEDLNQQHPLEEKPDVCINCGSAELITTHPNKLCARCRSHFIKFPIPLWVKLFGAGVIVAMLISLIWLPGNLSAALNLAKAEKAEKEHNYLTEQHELEKALKTAPQSEDILMHLAIASFYNLDIKTLYASADALYGKKMEDTSLVNQVNYVMNQAQKYLPDSAATKAFEKYKAQAVPDTAYQHFLVKAPDNLYVMMLLASNYSDELNYVAADTLLTNILKIQPDYLPALQMLTMVKREMNQNDASLKYCDQLLQINHQNIYAMSSKARTLIKTRKNAEGLQLAKQVYALDQKDGYNKATLVLAYHFNHDLKRRDEMMISARADTVAAYYLKYVEDAVNNKINYQN